MRDGLSSRLRVRVVAISVLWTLLAVVVVVALSVATVSMVRVVAHARKAVDLSDREREALAAEFDGLQPDEFRFLRQRVNRGDRFYLVVGEATRRAPFTSRTGRNFALWFLYPAVAVDRLDSADVVIGIDGASLPPSGVSRGDVERRGGASIARRVPR